MEFLVTGATGFVGGALVRHLRARGDGVRALVHDPSAIAAFEGLGVRAAVGSVLDPTSIAAAAEGADVVVHPPALESPRAPAEACRWALVAGTENVLSAARHAGAGRVVLVSSTDVSLAAHDRVHWGESRPIEGPPVGARAQALRLAEEIAVSTSDAVLEVTALRPAWLWGPGDVAALPALVREARATGLTMHGEGRNLVATTSIDTLLDAIVAAARAPSVAGRVYHVADPDFLELREFFQLLGKALGLPPHRRGLPRPLAYARARLGLGVDAPGGALEDVVRRGWSTLFDVQRASDELGLSSTPALARGLPSLARWVDSVGGLDAVAAMGDPGEAALVRDALAAARGRGVP